MPGDDIDADLKVIAEPLDWYGINFYQPTKVGAPLPAAAGAAIRRHRAARPNSPSRHGRSRAIR